MRDFCVTPVGYKYDTINFPSSETDSLLISNAPFSNVITPQDILVANATGTLSLIKNMLDSSGNQSMPAQLIIYRYKEQVEQLLLPVKTEVAAVLVELDCEASRVKQLSSYIGGLNSKRNTRLTAGAVFAGAVSTISPVLVTSKTPQNIIVIGSGVIAAGLGLLTLHPGGKKVRLLHTRNLLEDIWFLPKKSGYFSPALWYILNEPKLSNNRQLSKAAIVKTRWLKFELGDTIDKSAEQLLFKEGGIYNADNLDLRVTMLNELQTAVKSVDQDLLNFMLHLSNITLKPR